MLDSRVLQIGINPDAPAIEPVHCFRSGDISLSNIFVLVVEVQKGPWMIDVVDATPRDEGTSVVRDCKGYSISKK